ncbi:MAG: M20 family metallopeptidase [Anaerococcus sp.]|uniref:M20 metallopeptidase family protein n=1 Tax=Anaerococcus sp. TaxID=1872515 RepID=UPI002904245C|nr:M20 family metallopeptidase [Anaerococcus sp.]MDU2565130.1 M20 family metallopeptidase [Anaerococcus sp.]
MFLEKANELFDYTVDIRRKMHKIPEIAGKEEETVKLVCQKLGQMGVSYDIVNQGGILGFIDGNKNNNNPKTILLRADLDALPFDEPDNNLSKPRIVKSKNEGVMHACGHDGHTSILLTAARILNEVKNDFAGSVILCFERGEESGKGYKYLLAYLDSKNINIDACYAIHVSPDYKSGVMAIGAGGINAGSLAFDITIKGNSGHGSRPYEANNPLDCFVDIYSGLKSLRMNNFSPFDPMTYSIGAVQMGNKYNQIPDKLRFRGSMRFFDREKVGYKFYEDFKSLIINKSKANNCKVIFDTYTKPRFPIINDLNLSALVLTSMTDELGEDFVKEASPSMGSDTFATYSYQWPSLYIMLGINNEEKGSGAALHSPKFDLDEKALIHGTAATARFVVDFLNSDIELADRPYKNRLRDFFIEEDRSDEEIEDIYETITR